MRYILTIIFLFCTKILLMGTIHFETFHKNKFELKAANFLSSKRQAGLKISKTSKRTSSR